MDKSIKRNDDLTAYDLAIQNNEFTIAKVLKKLNFVDRYICMRTELTPFSYTRNDIILLLIFTTLIFFKLIYIIRLYCDFKEKENSSDYINKNKNIFYNVIISKSSQDANSKCRLTDSNDTCTFDIFFEIFLILNLLLDLSIILSILYFNCCIKSKKELKMRDRSLIVK